MADYNVVWPRSSKTVDVKRLAPRLKSLEGATVAFLWDYLFRGDEIWPVLSDELAARYPGMHFIGFEEFGSTHGDEEHEVLAALPDKLKALHVDAVVSGMGC
jgi:hypothetical protein